MFWLGLITGMVIGANLTVLIVGRLFTRIDEREREALLRDYHEMLQHNERDIPNVTREKPTRPPYVFRVK